MATLVTVAGRTRSLPATWTQESIDAVVGLDPDGRIVVDHFDALNAEFRPGAIGNFLFGLTLCCNASDKGIEEGVACRACYGLDESGSYLWQSPDGTYPELDPKKEILP